MRCGNYLTFFIIVIALLCIARAQLGAGAGKARLVHEVHQVHQVQGRRNFAP